MSNEMARTGRRLHVRCSSARSTMHACCECIFMALWQSVHCRVGVQCCRVDGVQCWPFRLQLLIALCRSDT